MSTAALRFAIIGLLAGLVAAPAAQTPAAPGKGTIRGRVVVPDPASHGRPTIADLAAALHPPVDRSRVVVFLQDPPAGAADDAKRERARMDQRNEEFVPRVLAITTGTTVDFPNDDKTFHDVFSLSRVKSFDLGRYPPGKTGSVRFDRAGVVPVFCDIHSHMSAYILVFSHPFFSVSDETGRYEIPQVPAGAYTVAVWSELGSAVPQRVVVPEHAVVQVDFRVGREP